MCFGIDLTVSEVETKAMLLLWKFTQGEAHLCADQALDRRLNRIFDLRGLVYKGMPKLPLSSSGQAKDGCSPNTVTYEASVARSQKKEEKQKPFAARR